MQVKENNLEYETVNIEPSWKAIAEIAILHMETGDKDYGRQVIRAIGNRLADARSRQENCPDHLREG